MKKVKLIIAAVAMLSLFQALPYMQTALHRVKVFISVPSDLLIRVSFRQRLSHTGQRTPEGVEPRGMMGVHLRIQMVVLA